MFTARQKIKKEKGEPTELENQVDNKNPLLSVNPSLASVLYAAFCGGW